MKITFRIVAELGNEQGKELRSEQSLRSQRCPVYPPSPWSTRCLVSKGTSPTKDLADHSLRRGIACCASCDASDRRYALADRGSLRAIASRLRFQPQPVGHRTAPTSKRPREITQFSGISTRFWSKSRSCRKQTIKPFLPGARTAQCDALFLRDFCANFALARPPRERPPVAWRALKS
jgi:hypothetical protein